MLSQVVDLIHPQNKYIDIQHKVVLISNNSFYFFKIIHILKKIIKLKI